MNTFRNIKLWILGLFLVSAISVNSQTIDFNIQGLNIQERDTFVVALQTSSDLTGEDVYAYRFHITYSTSYFEFLAVDSVGDILDAWGLPTINSSNPGQLRLAGAGANSLTGTGDVVYLKFRSLRTGGNYISFDANQSYLNEGAPEATFTRGYVSAAARPQPNIYPDSRQMFVGETVTMTASGGLEPYVFSTENTDVALIEDGTVLRAVGPGTTRALVTDDNGEVNYSTGLFDVRAVKMSIPDTVSGWPNQTILMPLDIEVAAGTQVFSGNIEFSFPGGVTPSDDPIQMGDYAVSVEKRVVGDRLHISFASGNAVTGEGVLMYIPFVANTDGNHLIRFQNTIFNESLLSYNTNDYIRVNALPDISVSPNSGTMKWGESLTVTASNGNAPYTYEVSNPEVASVDTNGEVTGLSGGTFRVTATDNYGAQVTTGTFTVYDHTLTIENTDGNLDVDTRVAVSTDQLPTGRDIFSFEGNITFNTNHLDFVSIEPLDAGMMIETIVDGGNIQLVGASANGINSGDVFYLNFRIKNTVPILGNTYVNFGTFTLNENKLFTIFDNGVVTRIQQDTYRPVADAGNNFSANENTVVQLDGSDSYDLDGDPLTYVWVAPQGITLDDPTLVNPSFTAPEVLRNTVYTFALVANDGTSDSDTSKVNVTILQVNKAPVANAGMDASYPEGNNVNLDGTGSYDPDEQALIYSWQSLDGVTLFNYNSATPSFIAPSVQENTEYRFRLVVSDGIVDSEADTVTIEVLQVNQVPEAFAGSDQTVNEGDQVQLDGSLSSDPDNDEITYLWTAPAEVTLSSVTIANPTFTAPGVRLDSTLVFTLVVNDGQSNSLPDEVRINVLNIDVLNDEANILGVTLPDLVTADIDETEATVVMHMPYGYDVRDLAPVFELSEWATIDPANGTHLDFSLPQAYEVTAENGTDAKSWTVSVDIPTVTLSRNIASGWNMLSLPVIPNNAALNEVMSSLNFEQLDYLKSPFASATFYNGHGWYGDLDEFPNFLTVKHRKNTGGNWQVTGKLINPTLESIPLTSGWNSLPYLLNANADIDAAIIPASIPTGDVLIKGEAGASIYYPGSGWTGDITQLELMHGYKIKVQHAGTLRYDAAAVTTAPPMAKMKSAKVVNPFSHQYKYSSNLISELVDESGNSITQNGDCLMAYSNGELCGKANAVFAGGLGRHIFVLSFYGNQSGETVTFKVNRNDREFNLNKQVSFNPDEVIGGAYQPEALVAPIATDVNENKAEGELMISPNPAFDILNMDCNNNVERVVIYNTTGTKVKELDVHNTSKTIDIANLPPGIYFIEIEMGAYVYLRKFIKRSK